MDIRTQLLKGNSRANAEAVAAYVGGDPDRFRTLMQCMLDVDRRTGQLASHSVAIVCETHPDLAVTYLGRLLDTLDAPVHEAVQRNSIRIMQTCTLPQRFHGRITTVMFGLIADPQRSIAQRAFAITVAARMVQAHPGLAAELRFLLEDALRADPGPAIRSRASKLLNVLAQRR